MQIKEKIISGSAWTVGAGLFRRFANIIFTIIIARILFPEDYGLFGIAIILLEFFGLFSHLGLNTALIQKKDLSVEHLHSTFWINIFTGLILCSIFVISAPFFAGFFKKPDLINILYAMSVMFIFNALSSVPHSILIRRLKFKTIAAIEGGRVLLEGAVGITIALYGFGVWALVGQSVFGLVFLSITKWICSGWKPRFLFAVHRTKDLLGFSMNILASQVIKYFSDNIPQITIGRFLSAASLGYYSLARGIMLLPITHITDQINTVLFPAFSSIQEKKDTIHESYLKAINIIAAVVFPIMVGIIIIAPEGILFLLGDKWRPLIWVTQLLSAAGIFMSIASPAVPLLLSQGKAFLNLKLSIFFILLITLSVFIGLRWEIKGIVFLYMLSCIIYSLVVSLSVSISLKISFRDTAASIFPGLASSLIMTIALVLLKNIIVMVFDHAFLIILFSIIAGIFFYIFSLMLFFRSTFEKFLKILALLTGKQKNLSEETVGLEKR